MRGAATVSGTAGCREDSVRREPIIAMLFRITVFVAAVRRS